MEMPNINPEDIDVVVVDHMNGLLDRTRLNYNLHYNGENVTVPTRINDRGDEDLGLALAWSLGGIFGRDLPKISAAYSLIISAVAPGFSQLKVLTNEEMLDQVQQWIGKNSTGTVEWVDMGVECVFDDHVLFRSPWTVLQTWAPDDSDDKMEEALICDLQTLNPKNAIEKVYNGSKDWVERFYPDVSFVDSQLDLIGPDDFRKVGDVTLNFTLVCLKMILDITGMEL